MKYLGLSIGQLFKNHGGFIYIDALVGIVILAIALTFMGGTYQRAVANSVYTDQNTAATSVARQALEALKDQDNLKQAAVGTSNFTLPAPTTTIINGVTYTTMYNALDLGNTLGRLTTEITPVQVTVTWKHKPTDATNTTLTMVDYYSIEPYFSSTYALDSSAPKTRFKIYATHGVSGTNGSGAMQHAVSPNDGYFYSTKSKFKKLWDQDYSATYAPLDPIVYAADGITITNPDNRAATNNWGISGDILEFDNLTIPASAAGQCDVFSFKVMNDGPSYAEYANPNYIDPTQWGLPSNYTTFTFNIYLSSTYNSTMTDSLKDTNGDGTLDTKYLLVSNAQVVASDIDDNGLTAGTGKTYTLSLPDPTNKNKNITVTAQVIDGAVKIFGLPAGNTYSIGLQWLVDAGNTSTNQKSGTDANALISNLSLTKGTIK